MDKAHNDKVRVFKTANCDPPPNEDETAVLNPYILLEEGGWDNCPDYAEEGWDFGAWLAHNTTPEFYKGVVQGLSDELAGDMFDEGWEQLDFDFFIPD